MKKLLLVSILALFPNFASAAKIAVTVGDGTLQPNTTAGFNVSSGTVKDFNPINVKSTGTWTLTGTTMNNTASIRTGTITDRSTYTLSGQINFSGGSLAGLQTDYSTGTHTGQHIFKNQTTIFRSSSTGEVVVSTMSNQASNAGAAVSRVMEVRDIDLNTGYYFKEKLIARTSTPSNLDPMFQMLLSNGSEVKLFEMTSSSITLSTPTYIAGTITNDDAPSGMYGQYISSQCTATLATPVAASGVFGNVGQITLTSGDWDVTGMFTTTANGATITTQQGAVSIFSGNTLTDHIIGVNHIQGAGPVNGASGSASVVPNYRITVAANSSTIVYIKAALTYSVATPNITGFRISARRER